MSDPRSRPATPIDTNSSETYFYSHYLCWQSLPGVFFFGNRGKYVKYIHLCCMNFIQQSVLIYELPYHHHYCYFSAFCACLDLQQMCHLA